MCLAIPGQILGLAPGGHFAEVDIAGVRRSVNVDLLDDIERDDWVLIHVGFAMTKVSERRAREQLELLGLLGEDEAAREEASAYQFAGAPPGDKP